jgi:hypothetical protein
MTTHSPLEAAHPEHDDKPFFAETLQLLRSVRDHDFETLADLCDDDFGIVDIAPDGTNVAIRSRAEWEGWFHGLFAQLDAMSAATDSTILAYDAVASEQMGFSVVEFRQSLAIGELIATFDCIATIVWKQVDGRWREARWHGSVLSSQVPPELMAAAEATG